MPCYHPIPGWYGRVRGESGKLPVVFRMDQGYVDKPISVPCGNCVGCILEKARLWAVRCMHEASLWERNCFVTLTYDAQHLDPGGSLVPDHFVRFMKRLRHVERGVRFFQCGEYGEKLGRPHHHALLFNCEFSDKQPLGNGLWTSEELSRLWPYGFSSIGEVTFQSAGYVARYALKKVKGHKAAEHYGGKVPEYLTMSRRPGIGRGWIEKFASDVYPSDELVVNGVATKPPRYYDDVAAKMNPSELAYVKHLRRESAKDDPEKSGRRLVVKEKVKKAAMQFLKRDLEGT